MFQDVGKGTFSHNLTAANSRSGAEIHNPVGGAHGVFIVLYNNNGIPEIPQAKEALDEPIVISRMEPNAWFIKYVKNANQPAADLSRESNTLGFTS
jgi:hypothetical protein